MSSQKISNEETGSLQAEVFGESVAEFVAMQSSRGQAIMYAEHDALMRTEKHIWKFNKFPEKNRNPSSVCYNEGAVELTTANKKEEKLDKDQTYINANQLRSPLGNFILAQAPMSNTLVDWFRMIWQMKIAIIVSLVDLENMKIKNRFRVRTISMREEEGGIINYQLRLKNKLSLEKQPRTLYVISMPTQLNEPIHPRKQLKLVAEMWATEMAIAPSQETSAPILVHGCNGVSRTAAFVATCMLCKSLITRGEMSPLEVWARLNHARHNAAKERIHFLSSIECALLFAVDNGLIPAEYPQLEQVNVMIHAGYQEDRRKARPPSASRECSPITY
ncbi:hypothetical protein Q1695_016234 [Nippostrongylus brasiliensis]|nr:hypothetical protein Q1695_016234 [Nippostrongylus brasiliensis]